jgi:hypothetical protein
MQTHSLQGTTVSLFKGLLWLGRRGCLGPARAAVNRVGGRESQRMNNTLHRGAGFVTCGDSVGGED